MRRYVLHQGIFLAGFLCLFSFAAGENLLTNPSFEDSRNNRPVRWRTMVWNGQASLEMAPIGHTGNASVMIDSSSGGDVAWTQTVRVEPNSRYRLSGWIKTENLQAGNARGALLNVQDYEGVETPAVKGTQDWTKVECEFVVEMDDSIQINCLYGGWGTATGKAWYDDIALEKIGAFTYESKTVEAEVSVDASQTFEPISKYIYGQFIEHLGQCIYGGIWAEMVEDRKFFFPVPAERDIWRRTEAGARVLAASPWKVIGPKEAVLMTTDHPLSGRHSVQISTAAGTAGIYQEELALMQGRQYTGRIVLRGEKAAGPVQVSLVWGDGASQRQTVAIKNLSKSFEAVPLKFQAGADTDNGRLEIVGSGQGAFVVGAVSLMPADNVEGFRRDTLELLRQLNAPVYRWPGGNFVSGYDWRDGLGDRDRRPTRTNPAWTGIETNDVGMHEFIALCRLINSEPMIAVNTGFGDAYSAAAEVEYANGSVGTAMGKLRQQNGSKEPFAVKWWCVGNEMFGNWQLGYMQLNHYVLKHNWVEEKMRQVDPTIKTVASGEIGGGWTEGMLRSCADHMDLISEHFYCQNRSDITAHVRQIPNAIKSKCDAHRRFRQTIPELKGKDIRIAMDEWNYWYGPHVFGELGTRYFMKDALGIAAGLHEYFRNSDICFMANYAQTVNVIGCIKTTKTAAGFDATAYPLMLYRKEYGTLPVKVDGSGDRLDVAAALTEDKAFLTIGVVNATRDTYKLRLNLTGAGGKGAAKTWVIAHANPLAYNEPGKEPVIAIQQAADTDISQPITAAPLSISLYKLPVK